MTFGQMRSLVSAALQEFRQAGNVVRPVLDEHIALWVNQGYIRLCADLLVPQSKVIVEGVVGQRHYTLESNILQVVWAMWEGRELTRILSVEEVARQDSTETITGTPEYWAWTGRILSIFPAAAENGNLELWCILTPNELEDNTETPQVAAHLHELIVDFAMYQAMRHIGDIERMMAYYNLYNIAIEKERANIVNRPGLMQMRKDARAGM